MPETKNLFQHNYFLLFFLLLCSLAFTMVTPFLGLSNFSLDILWAPPGEPNGEIFWKLRVPRAIGAFLAGAGLGVSGLMFQSMFRNPLATPFTLGVSSGASLGTAIYVMLGLSLGFMGGFFFSLGGAILSMLLVYLITKAKGGFSTIIMLLAGVIINLLFSSLVLFIQYLADNQSSLKIMHWMMGSLSGLNVLRLTDLAVVVLCGSFLIWLFAPEMDLLSTGEELAISRGVNVDRLKLLIFIIASLIVAAVVSLSGPIGFIGLVAPQLARLLLGWSHRLLIPAVFFGGGAFLALCDLAARLVLAPAEVPVGIITALLGGPFFLVILATRKI